MHKSVGKAPEGLPCISGSGAPVAGQLMSGHG